MIKTEPTDDYEPPGAPRMPIHSKPYYGQQRLPPMMPLGDADPCMVGSYSPCPPCPTAIPCSSPGSSPKLHDLSPVPFPKCLSSSPTHPTMPVGVASLRDTPTHPGLTLPSSPDHTSLTMPHPQGSPHLSSPSYHPLYPSSSPSSSPNSHPSTPGATAESPYLPPFGPRGSPPSLLEDSSSPALSVTIKQEPQELDQMYLDDGRSLRYLILRHIDPAFPIKQSSCVVIWPAAWTDMNWPFTWRSAYLRVSPPGQN